MSLNEKWRQFRVSDGRLLEVVTAGPENGRPLLFQTGTPTAAVPFGPAVDAAARHGLRTILYSRPGYAASTPDPGRTVASSAPDIADILDALGHDQFVTVGWSGGGPHALACGALLADRCQAVATIAAVAPYPAAGLAWLAGMADENVQEFTRAIQGEASLRPGLLELLPQFQEVTGAHVSEALGGLVSDVDKAALTDAFAENTAASFRRALSRGIEGWLEDSLAFVKPWGFELAEIRVPVTIWQGGEDRMVPFSHGEWLARHVPGATARLLPEDGHLSLAVGCFERIVGELVAAAASVA